MSLVVLDPFDAVADAALPTLADALDPDSATRELNRLPRLSGARDGSVRLLAIRVTRHKPGRRCLVEYDVEVQRENSREAFTIIGKLRVHRFGKSGYRMLSALREAGFHDESRDGISVPEPIGVVPAFRMWMQRKVAGRPVTELLGPGETVLARRIAEAAHKVHSCRVQAESRHAMGDELRILRECLGRVAAAEPRWEKRLDRLLKNCERLGNTLARTRTATVHRDFYADQILVDGCRLTILDFDLCCRADPGLDPGNFLGHMTEQALRIWGNPAALRQPEQALEERFIELSGEAVRPSLRAYAALTLVRHVYLSSRLSSRSPERRAFTEDLLSLCEERLSASLRP